VLSFIYLVISYSIVNASLGKTDYSTQRLKLISVVDEIENCCETAIWIWSYLPLMSYLSSQIGLRLSSLSITEQMLKDLLKVYIPLLKTYPLWLHYHLESIAFILTSMNDYQFDRSFELYENSVIHIPYCDF
jgi:hypothetical protein